MIPKGCQYDLANNQKNWWTPNDSTQHHVVMAPTALLILLFSRSVRTGLQHKVRRKQRHTFMQVCCCREVTVVGSPTFGFRFWDSADEREIKREPPPAYRRRGGEVNVRGKKGELGMDRTRRKRKGRGRGVGERGTKTNWSNLKKNWLKLSLYSLIFKLLQLSSSAANQAPQEFTPGTTSRVPVGLFLPDIFRKLPDRRIYL